MVQATWQGSKGTAIELHKQFQEGSICSIVQKNSTAVKNSKLFNAQSASMIQEKIASGDNKAWAAIPDLVFITKRTKLSLSAISKNSSIYSKNVNPDDVGSLVYEFWQAKSYKCNEDAVIRRKHELLKKESILKNTFDYGLYAYLNLLEHAGYANAVEEWEELFATFVDNK